MKTSSGIAPARAAAFEILRKIVREQGNSDSLLHARQVDELSPLDRNLCTALVFGALRWQRVLDSECRRFLSLPDAVLSDDALLALRVGAFQLLFMDRIPAHAAIFDSVEWAKRSEASHQSGLVNAVLRKVAQLPKGRASNALLAYPEWMVERWRKIYGEHACKLICEYGQQEPDATVRLLADNAENQLRDAGLSLKPGAFLTQARITDTAMLSAHVGAQLQDEGSQLIAELLGNGNRILDCCAAPGGKTAIVAAKNPGAELLACDINGKRLAAMQRRLQEILPQQKIEYCVVDAARLARVGPFDRILCDVPCTGTGTLARNPEIRHRLQPSEIARQAERQRSILTSALRLLGPGGRLLYSTCSLEPEENQAVVEACLNLSEPFAVSLRKLDLRAEFDQLTQRGIAGGEAVEKLRATAFSDGYLRTLPGIHPCDGFFAALIERV